MTNQTESTNDIIAQVVKLSEGYVLQLTGGRTVGYPTVAALGKGLVRELRRKPRSVAEPAAALTGVNVQWFNLARLCDSAMSGEIDTAAFERGLTAACPDVSAHPHAQGPIEAARSSLQKAVSPRGENGPTVNKANGIGWQAATRKADKRKPVGPVPWVCGYCKRPSDCLFDTGETMDLLPGLDSPCETCQKCLDDSCDGEPAPEAHEDYHEEWGPPPAITADDVADFQAMQTEVRYIVDNQGKRIGTLNVEAE